MALTCIPRRRALLRPLAFAAALAGAAPALAEPPAPAAPAEPDSQRSNEPTEQAMPAIQVTWPDTAAELGTPNLFGSVPRAVSHSPLDPEWTRATQPGSLTEWIGAFSILSDDNRETLLSEVNLWVNERLAEDRQHAGRADRRPGAAETPSRATSDGEEHALTKMQLLAALGFDADDLYLVVVRDTVRQGDHAILAVRLGARFVVLDNLHEDVVDSALLPNYRPMISRSASGRRVRGYPAAPPPPIRPL